MKPASCIQLPSASGSDPKTGKYRDRQQKQGRAEPWAASPAAHRCRPQAQFLTPDGIHKTAVAVGPSNPLALSVAPVPARLVTAPPSPSPPRTLPARSDDFFSGSRARPTLASLTEGTEWLKREEEQPGERIQALLSIPCGSTESRQRLRCLCLLMKRTFLVLYLHIRWVDSFIHRMGAMLLGVIGAGM